MYPLDVYDADFFSTNTDEGLRMATWFIPLLERVFRFDSLIDVGCGRGHYLLEADKRGHRNVVGIEGSRWAAANALVSAVIHHDLRRSMTYYPKDAERFDLCISIEVAEHIEPEYAETFVRTLCARSDTIVMTAAPPGQGGTMHVNEQPMEYWQELFGRNHFVAWLPRRCDVVEGIRWARTFGFYVTNWFEPNVMVFRREA